MARMRATQFTFTRGEIGADLDFRSDIALYASGAKYVNNMMVLPQGGLIKRRGFGLVGATPNAVRLVKFGFSAEQEYVIVFYNQSFEIFFTDISVFDSAYDVYVVGKKQSPTVTTSQTVIINGTTVTFSGSLALAAIVDEINAYTATTGVVAQAVDNYLQLWNQGDQQAIVIGSGTANTALGLTAATYNLITCPYTEAQLAELKTSQKFDALFLVQKDVPPYQLMRGLTHYDWTLEEMTFDSIPFERFNITQSLTPSGTTGTVTLTLSGSASYWTADHVGVRLRVNDGYVNISSVNSGLQVTGTVLNFLDTSSLGTTSADNAWAEEIWSAAHGYPRTVTQHQSRLIFGGTRDLPQTIVASSSGDYTNFDTDTADDDRSWTKEIGTQNVNTIRSIVGRNDLHIFTNESHFVIVGDDAVTPSAGRVAQQNSPGIDTTQPVEFYKNIVFITDDGKTIQMIEYDSDVFQYKSSNLTTLSQDLVNNPIDMAYIANYGNSQGNLLLIVNGDGTAVCLVIDTEKEVFGFSRFTTDGYFRRVIEVDNALYALVDRIASDGSTLTTFLEKLTEQEIYLDHFYSGTNNAGGTTSWNNAETLAGQTVSCVVSISSTNIADALVHEPVSVDGSGNFSTAVPAQAVAIGLSYDAEVQTLPVAFAINNNLVRGERFRKVSAEVRVRNTKEFKVDGYKVLNNRIGTNILDGPQQAQDAILSVNLKGLGNNQNLVLLSDQPLPFQVNGITVDTRYRA